MPFTLITYSLTITSAATTLCFLTLLISLVARRLVRSADESARMKFRRERPLSGEFAALVCAVSFLGIVFWCCFSCPSFFATQCFKSPAPPQSTGEHRP